MAGLGNVFVFGRSAGGLAGELVSALGTEVLHVCADAGVAVTAANGVRAGLQDHAADDVPTARAHAALDAFARQVGLTQITVGDKHAVAVTKYGSVYTLGSNARGQLGIGQSHTIQRDFHLVKALDSRVCVAVAAGAHHSVALTDDGAVYAWGRDEEGQCGLGNSTTRQVAGANQPFPRYVSALARARVQHVAAGARHTLALTDRGEVYAWGEGLCGQLGVGAIVTSVNVPTRVRVTGMHPETEAKLKAADADADAPSTAVSQICAGFAHSLALTESGHVLAWGLNSKGQLGTNDTDNRAAPTPVLQAESLKPLVASCIAAAAYHSAALDASGRLLTWGSADNGRLGHTFEHAPAYDAIAELETTLSDVLVQTLDSKLSPAALTSAESAPNLDEKQPREGAGKDHRAAPGETWRPDLRFTASVEQRRLRVIEHTLREMAAAKGHDMSELLYRALHGLSADATASGVRQQIAEAFARTGLLPPGHTSAQDVYTMKELRLVAAAVGIDMRDVLPHADAVEMPWLRTPLAKAQAGIVPVATIVQHAVLHDRRLSRVACGPTSTWCVADVQLQHIFPRSGLDTGGSVVALEGPGMAALCRLAYSTADATESSRGGWAATLTPDATGMIPIPGVMIRFTVTPEQPGRRPGDLAPEDVTADGHHERRDGQHAHFFSKAYLPVGWVPGAAGARFGHNDGFIRRPDGTWEHGYHDLRSDRILAVSPATPRPVRLQVHVVYRFPEHPVHSDLAATSASAVRTHVAGMNADIRVLDGEDVFSTFALPAVTGTDPGIVSASSLRSGAGVVSLTGDNLFGLALLDAAAQASAEALIDLTRAEVARREDGEAYAVSVVSVSTSGQARSKGNVPRAVQREESVAPTLHLRKTGGSRDAPNDVLVRFSVLQGDRVLATSQAVRGWFDVMYDEALVHIGGVVDAMTGTTAAAGNARTAASAITGAAGGSVLHGGARNRSFLGGSVPGTDEDEEEDNGEDEEGVVGKYAAQISCQLPMVDIPSNVGAALPAIPEEVTEVYERLRSAALQPVDLTDRPPMTTPAPSSAPTSGQSSPRSARAPISSVQAAAVGVDSPRAGGLDGDVRRRVMEYDFAMSLGGGVERPSDVLVRPEISANGQDFLPALSSAWVRTYAPAFSHVDPPCGPSAGGFTAFIRGSGFLPSATLLIRFTPVDTDGKPLSGADAAAVTVPGEFQDSTTISVEVPELKVLPAIAVPAPSRPVSPRDPTSAGESAATTRPHSPNTAGGAPASTGRTSPVKPVPTQPSGRRNSATKEHVLPASAPVPAPAPEPAVDAAAKLPPAPPIAGAVPRAASAVSPCGYTTYAVGVSVDGVTFDSAPAMMLVVYAGRVAACAPTMLPLAGGTAVLQLEQADADRTDALSKVSWQHHPLCRHWLPPVAAIGHPCVGLGTLISARVWNEVGLMENVPVLVDTRSNVLHIQMPSLAELSAASGWAPPQATPAPGSSAGSVSPRTAQAAASPYPPALRTCNVQLVVAGVEIVPPIPMRYYEPHTLSITSVAPKKLQLGAELVITVEGLDTIFAGRDGLAEKKTAAAGARPAGSAASGGTAPPPSATRPDMHPPAPELLQCRVRITGGGAAVVLVARPEGASSVQVALPASGVLDSVTVGSPVHASVPTGDVTIEVSIDGGVAFTHPTSAKIAKK